MNTISHNNLNNDFNKQIILLRAPSLDDLISQLMTKPCQGYKKLLSLYCAEQKFPDMDCFKLGSDMFRKIPFYFIILLSNRAENTNSKLIAHGITADILWGSDYLKNLPEGWQGVVRRRYENTLNAIIKNTLVGLYIRCALGNGNPLYF
jgi:hypothetical protein